MSELENIKARAAKSRQVWEGFGRPDHAVSGETYTSTLNDLDRAIAIAEEVGRYNLIIHALVEPDALERVNRLQLDYEQALATVLALRDFVKNVRIPGGSWKLLADTESYEQYR